MEKRYIGLVTVVDEKECCDKVAILGTEYRIYRLKQSEDKRLIDRAGFVDCYTKEIRILKCEKDDNDLEQIGDLMRYENRVLRHEIIHAFLHESGLDVNTHDVEQWAMNEEMVDWFALQFPKIAEVFDELDITY